MIDCLSNSNWLSPQIDCLLFLQNIRIGLPDFIDKIFLSVTVFGEFWLPTIICAITYWCLDYKAGIYLFTLEGANVLLTHLLKMAACVYRPWILDSNIHPSELAIPYAKGYSFPSGHSAMSSSILGGGAYLLRKNTILCVCIIFLILTIGFSRLWLGVHTPQDVASGFAIGIILIFLVNKIINWAEKNKNRYLYLLGALNIFVVIALIYISRFNCYRVDYIGTELLVNPQKSIYFTWLVYGYALGLLNGLFLCRKFCPFNPKTASVKCRIIRGVIGVIGVIVLLKCILSFFVINVFSIKLSFGVTFFMGISITLFYPIIFTHTENIFFKKL